jgi:DNA-binding response OmpR family regulator
MNQIFAQAPPDALPATPAPRLVLAVDDDPNFRRIVQFALQMFGYTVLITGTAQDALKLAAQNPGIDLLITDVTMPVMNGVELAQKIREIQPNIAVLYVSGYPFQAMAARGIDIDSMHFLQKPFQTEVLDERIKTLLSGAKATG